MLSYNSQVSKNDYKLQVETDNYEQFKILEAFIRLMIDNSNLSKTSTTTVNVDVQKPNIVWPANSAPTIKL